MGPEWRWALVLATLSGSFGQAGLGGTVFPSETGRRFLGEGSPTWGAGALRGTVPADTWGPLAVGRGSVCSAAAS